MGTLSLIRFWLYLTFTTLMTFVFFNLLTDAFAEEHKGKAAPLAAVDSPDKWTGYLEFLAKPGTARNYGQSDLFAPLWQDENNLSFLNVRGLMDVDSNNKEVSVGLGHRQKFGKFILGSYLFIDYQESDSGFEYFQLTSGLEYMSPTWQVRSNFYLPQYKINSISESHSKSFVSSTSATTFGKTSPTGQTYQDSAIHLPTATMKHRYIQANSQIKSTRTTNIEKESHTTMDERALSGFDLEVGYRITSLPFFDELHGYVGGYYFHGENGFENITGSRVRIEAQLFDLELLGNGSKILLGVESQFDKKRGVNTAGIFSLRIPLDFISDAVYGKSKKLKGLDRLMMSPVVRDVGIHASERKTVNESFATTYKVKNVTLNSEHEIYKTTPMIDWQGNEFDAHFVVNSDAELKKLTQLNDPTKRYLVELAGDKSAWTSKWLYLKASHTYTARGSEFNFKYRLPDSDKLISGVINNGSTLRLEMPESRISAYTNTHLNGVYLYRASNPAWWVKPAYIADQIGKFRISNSRFDKYFEAVRSILESQIEIHNSVFDKNQFALFSVYTTTHSSNNIFSNSFGNAVELRVRSHFYDTGSTFEGTKGFGIRGFNSKGLLSISLNGTTFNNGGVDIGLLGSGVRLVAKKVKFGATAIDKSLCWNECFSLISE